MSADASFRNEPLLEFRRESVRAQALRALDELRGKLPLRIAGRGGAEGAGPRASDGEGAGPRAGEGALVSTNPANPAELIATAPDSSRADADVAVARAAAGFTGWSGLDAAERAAVLQRAAGLMRERRQELAALAVL
ncbi:MAG: aldehyde dehydrogenase family protein, partial [Acidobacteriota bacterium]|nr:aldehyde dehydrogenase family protein [Acidobacteriota bacterium]